MKLILSSVVVASLSFLDLHTFAAGDKVQITAEKKRVDEDDGKTPGPGRQAKSSESEKYELKIQNTSFKDLANLTVDYVVFVDRQRLGEKQGSENTERKTGSKKIELLTAKAPQTVATDPIVLHMENLVGHFHYVNGGRIKAEDSLKGVWVRVSQDGQVIGEYIKSAQPFDARMGVNEVAPFPFGFFSAPWSASRLAGSSRYGKILVLLLRIIHAIGLDLPRPREQKPGRDRRREIVR